MVVVRAVHRLCAWLDRSGEYLCLVMLSAMVGITGAQIVCRVFFEALSWSEELARYLLVWTSLIGASCVYRRAGHISVTVLQGLLPVGARTAVQVLVHVLCAVFFSMMVRYGVIYTGATAAQLSPAMRIPMGYMYAAIPVGGALLLIQAADAILALLFRAPPAAEKAEEVGA